MTTAVAIFLSGVLAASTGQVLLKKGAMRGRERPLALSFFDPFVAVGYALMAASTVTSTIALRVLPLHFTVSLLPVGYVAVVLLSVLVLREDLRRHHIFGSVAIIAGIVVFQLGSL